MNWARVDTAFNDHDFGVFNYETRPFKIVKKLHSAVFYFLASTMSYLDLTLSTRK